MSIDIPSAENMGNFNERTSTERWVPGTRIDVCSVPWDSAYLNIVDFTDQLALDSYLDNQTVRSLQIRHATRLAPLEPIVVNLPYEVVCNENYVRAYNPGDVTYIDSDDQIQSESARTFYYFILDVRYKAPNTTELVLQLDVWNTYRWGIEFGRSYVERGHVGLANQNRGEDYGRKFLTVPEGLNLGNEYVNTIVSRETIASLRATDNDQKPGVIVWSTVDLLKSGGTIDDPKLVTATGTDFGGLPNGAEAYYFDSVKKFTRFMREVGDQPWMSQGLISVQLVPPLKRYFPDTEWGTGMDSPVTRAGGTVIFGGSPSPLTKTMMTNWRARVRERIPQGYRHLDKFLTFPYTMIELTTNTGAPIVIKPEGWADDDATITELGHLGLPSPRVMIFPSKYNKSANTLIEDDSTAQTHRVADHDGGEFMDMATGIFDFPTFSVVNNSYMGFLASNRNAISYQHQSADWSQQKTLTAAQTGYDQASLGISAATDQADSQMLANNQMLANANQHGTARAGLAGASSILGSVGGGPLGLLHGVASAATGGVNEAINQSERSASTGISNSALTRSTNISNTLTAGIRDSNLSLARFSARGDYANTIAGINAKVEDARMIQPTTSGQVGGEAFNMAVDRWGYDLKIKTLSSGAMRVIGDFWLRYGYAINAEMQVPQLSLMRYFTYWKFAQITITGARAPESYKQAFRGIFEKGVTVWREPEMIGRANPKANTIIEGNYYN